MMPLGRILSTRAARFCKPLGVPYAAGHATLQKRSLQTDETSGFDTIALHGGYDPDPSVKCGLGYGAPRGVPLYRSTPFVFRDTEHAANLFALKELGNIYSRITNPTNHILESRYAQLEGGHPLSGLAVASGTNAIFYALANLASKGDNIVSSSKLYGGTYTYV
jgi:O-acetylhomoserine (thiol)-lyase